MTAPQLHTHMTEEDRIEIRLAALNDCAPETARRQLLRCCDSPAWASQMVQMRPFLSMTHLEECADRVWESCSVDDRLKAFAAHPCIGEGSQNRWSRQEQSKVMDASAETMQELSQGNALYKNKFGYIFIICANGMAPSHILANLRERLHNSPQTEIRNAAEQQRLITRLRLRKLLGER